jgi:hypothetical protein
VDAVKYRVHSAATIRLVNTVTMLLGREGAAVVWTQLSTEYTVLPPYVW